MEILLVLIYVSICVVIFKLFRIPVNGRSPPPRWAEFSASHSCC